jgi:hypothetical protein
MPTENHASGTGKALLIAVVATVLSGIFLALILPSLLGPDLKLVKVNLYQPSTPGYVGLEIMVHNDSSVSVGNCSGYWVEKWPNGTTTLLANSEGVFYVPANSDALFSGVDHAIPIRFRVKATGFQNEGNMIVYVICNDYKSDEWTTFTNLAPALS